MGVQKLPQKTKYLIVGAGISGLSCAEFLGEHDYLIIEKEAQIGGFCKTFKQDGFVWDYAGHFFHFKSETIKNRFSNLLKGSDIVRNHKVTKVYFKGLLIDAPFQYNIHQLDKADFIDCLVGMFSNNYYEPKTFSEMLYYKYGKGISDRFLIPYNQKLYACDLKLLDKDAMGRFFPNADKEDIVRGFSGEKRATYNEEFFYSKNGAVAFVNEIAKNINKEKIRCNVEALKIHARHKYVDTNEGRIYYDFLINTLPFNAFLNLTDTTSYKPFTSNKVLVLNMGFDKASLDTSIHWIYCPDPDICFYRVGFYNNILHEEKMSIYVEVGFKENEEFDIDIYKQQILSDLKKIGVITSHKLVSYNAVVMSPAYVHISSESTKERDRIKKILESDGIFTIGRYGNWCYCSIEDCIIQAQNLINSLNRNQSV